jgi:hypothetical protein
MPRSEYAANQALAQSRPTDAAWLQPSRCKRAPRPSLIGRLVGLFTS